MQHLANCTCLILECPSSCAIKSYSYLNSFQSTAQLHWWNGRQGTYTARQTQTRHVCDLLIVTFFLFLPVLNFLLLLVLFVCLHPNNWNSLPLHIRSSDSLVTLNPVLISPFLFCLSRLVTHKPEPQIQPSTIGLSCLYSQKPIRDRQTDRQMDSVSVIES